MSHMVIYRGVDGKPGYHQTDDIHDAVGFVEQMRNEDGVEHARIFRLEEVVFEYRPYYRVELADTELAPERQAIGAAGDPARIGAGSDEAIDLTEPGRVGETIVMDDVADAADSIMVDPAGPQNGIRADAGSKRGLFGR